MASPFFLKTPPLLGCLPIQTKSGPPPVRWRNSSPPHGCNVQIHSATRLTRSATCAHAKNTPKTSLREKHKVPHSAEIMQVLQKMCFSYTYFWYAKKTSNLFVMKPVRCQLSRHRTLKGLVLDLQTPPPPARWPRHKHLNMDSQVISNLVFPKIVVPQNGWFIMETLLKWMIWGVFPPIFGNTQLWLDKNTGVPPHCEWNPSPERYQDAKTIID